MKNHSRYPSFKNIITKLVLLTFVAFTGCKYDKAELSNAVPTLCDTANLSYTVNILPIIKDHCYSCHAGNASGSFGINLDSYNALKFEAQSGELLRRIISNDPAEMMPKGGPKLSDCEINKINAWIQNGIPE